MKHVGLRIALAALLTLMLSSTAGAWGTGNCVNITNLHIHYDTAYKVVTHPDISWALSYFNLNAHSIASYAATEPQCWVGRHPSWTELRDQSHLNWGNPTNTLVGVILHVASDAGVGSCHCPACEVWCKGHAETLYEGTAETRSTPALTGVYTGSYSSRMTSFYNAQIANTRSFKSWYERTWYCRVYCDPWYWANYGEQYGMRLGHAAVLKYFCTKANWTPSQCVPF